MSSGEKINSKQKWTKVSPLCFLFFSFLNVSYLILAPFYRPFIILVFHEENILSSVASSLLLSNKIFLSPNLHKDSSSKRNVVRSIHPVINLADPFFNCRSCNSQTCSPRDFFFFNLFRTHFSTITKSRPFIQHSGNKLLL